jgi:hypothetical protein
MSVGDIPGYLSQHHLHNTTLEWFLKFRNPFGEYGALQWEPTFVSNELEFYVLAILTFMHAYRHGARYMWLWWTTGKLNNICIGKVDQYWETFRY